MKSWQLFACLALAMLVSSLAVAGIPTTISYQGRLLDSAGNPVADGPYLIRFQIYDAPTAGATLWSSSIRQISITNGFINYNLGDTVALPHDLFANDTALWLGIKVSVDPEMIPRTRLTANSFSYQALRSDSSANAAIAATVADNAIISSKIADGSIQEADLNFSPATDAELGAHATSSSAHHTKTTDASELSSGTLADARLSTNVPRKDLSNTFFGLNYFAAGASVQTNDLLLENNDLVFRRGGTHRWRLEEESTSGLLFTQVYNDANVLQNTVAMEIGDDRQVSINNLKVGDSTFHADNSGIRIGDNSSPSAAYLVRLDRNYSTTSTRYGVYSNVTNSSTGTLYGLLGFAGSSTTGSGGTTYGTYGESQSDGSNRYGLFGRAMPRTTSSTTGVSFGVFGDAYYGGIAYGVYGMATGAITNWAGYFQGNCNITGTLSKGGGSFRIDHPLDPENKYLQHSFVESPDMMNIYNGNVVTDGAGYATVMMPDYFDALNRDFRYQLTVIGEFAQAIIAEKLTNGRFTIQTDKPNIEVSWQVTGIRHDRWADANRIQVELDKPENERGYYVHYKEWDQPVSRAIDREAILAGEKAREESLQNKIY